MLFPLPALPFSLHSASFCFFFKAKVRHYLPHYLTNIHRAPVGGALLGSGQSLICMRFLWTAGVCIPSVSTAGGCLKRGLSCLFLEALPDSSSQALTTFLLYIYNALHFVAIAAITWNCGLLFLSGFPKDGDLLSIFTTSVPGHGRNSMHVG